MKKFFIIFLIFFSTSLFAEDETKILVCEIGSLHHMKYDPWINRTTIENVKSEYESKFQLFFKANEEYELVNVSVLNMKGTHLMSMINSFFTLMERKSIKSYDSYKRFFKGNRDWLEGYNDDVGSFAIWKGSQYLEVRITFAIGKKQFHVLLGRCEL